MKLRMNPRSLALCTVLVTVPCTAPALFGQALTSPAHVIMAHDSGSGGRTSSTKYELVGTFGNGVVAGRTAGTKFLIEGGFNAALDVPTSGSPVLSRVTPLYGTLRGQETLILTGTELDVGTAPTLRIGGQTATILSRSRDRITTRLPIQPKPGWLPVELSSSAGTTVLGRGVGVLPLIETRPAAASDVPFTLVFKGTRGDGIYWALGIGPAAPLILPGIHYGFALNPAFFIMLPGFGITNANGEFLLPFPATTYPTGTIYLQGMFVTSNPGYGPASFSNVLRL